MAELTPKDPQDTSGPEPEETPKWNSPQSDLARMVIPIDPQSPGIKGTQCDGVSTAQ